MKRCLAFAMVLAAGCGGSGTSSVPTAATATASPSPTGPTVGVFVTSATSTTGNLGGLTGADATCQRLATAAGLGGRTWRAYLSVERDATNGNQPANARDRIGSGPWYNVNLALVASTLGELHSRPGDAALFLDERGQRINGQWTGSPTPNQHDMLTGSDADGTLLFGSTCADWTSDASGLSSRVGHSDGLGPNQGTSGGLNSWNSAHAGQCANTTPGGGAGRFYCFAR